MFFKKLWLFFTRPVTGIHLETEQDITQEEAEQLAREWLEDREETEKKLVDVRISRGLPFIEIIKDLFQHGPAVAWHNLYYYFVDHSWQI